MFARRDAVKLILNIGDSQTVEQNIQYQYTGRGTLHVLSEYIVRMTEHFTRHFSSSALSSIAWWFNRKVSNIDSVLLFTAAIENRDIHIESLGIHWNVICHLFSINWWIWIHSSSSSNEIITVITSPSVNRNGLFDQTTEMMTVSKNLLCLE